MQGWTQRRRSYDKSSKQLYETTSHINNLIMGGALYNMFETRLQSLIVYRYLCQRIQYVQLLGRRNGAFTSSDSTPPMMVNFSILEKVLLMAPQPMKTDTDSPRASPTCAVPCARRSLDEAHSPGFCPKVTPPLQLLSGAFRLITF
jgi:hypothetical protein